MTSSAGPAGSVVTCLLFAGSGGGLPGLPFTGMTCLPFLAARARFSLLVHCVAIVVHFFLRAVEWMEEKGTRGAHKRGIHFSCDSGSGKSGNAGTLTSSGRRSEW